VSEHPHVLFVVTEDWYFVSHRLQLARRLLALGYRVSLAARFSQHQASLEALHINCVPVRMRRSGLGIWDELRSIAELRRVIGIVAPTIVHCVALKPVVYAGLATIGRNAPVTVNAIAGLGFLFSSGTLRARLGRGVLTKLLWAVLGRKSAWIIVQNPEDAETLKRANIGAASRTRLIRGAGVELDVYRSHNPPSAPPMVLMACRMLRNKGVETFVRVAQSIVSLGIEARFCLAGAPDSDNPASLTVKELTRLTMSDAVEWLGQRSDIPSLIDTASIICLPTTYGEGIPKILIEAAAGARPIVATDWAGCREIVSHDVNGLLVAPHSDDALRSALLALLQNPRRGEEMGRAGREIVERSFSIEAVTALTLDVYAAAASLE
jgi:glycosyltransferase involved in cell wall biosynthesis